MVARRRDTEDRRRVWVEIVPEAQQRLQDLQQPVAEEMRRVSQRFAAEELAIVRDYMRQAKEVFQRQLGGTGAAGGAGLPSGAPGSVPRGHAAARGKRRGKVGWLSSSQVGTGVTTVTALATRDALSRARRPDAVRLRLRPHAPPPAHGAQGPPGRQGRQPGRDDVGTPAPRPARVHDLDRRLPRLHGQRLAQGPRRRGGGGPGPARDGHGQGHRRRRRPAPRLGALGRQVLDARHDGHRPQPRPQRRVRRGPRQADRRRALRLRLVPALHRHVRPHRPRAAGRGVRLALRRRQGAGRHRVATPRCPSSSCATSSTRTSRSSSATPARPSPRSRPSSCAARSRPSSAAGTGRAPSPTASASASRTTSAPPSTSRRWSSATATTTRAPASASPATPRRGPRAPTATSWSTRRARTWWPASATPSPSRR